MKRIITLLAAIVSIWGCVSAQSQAAVNASEGGYGMLKTNVAIDYNHTWNRVDNGFSARASYEFFRNRKFTVTANARYQSVEANFRSGDLSDGFQAAEIGLNGVHIFGQTGFTSTFRTQLGGKPLMAMAMANAEWGQGGFARVSGIAMGILMLRASRDTQFGLGPLVMLNTSSKIPAFLVFMYRHRIDSRWLINLYGGMFGVDYTPTRRDMLSAGADVDVKSFYFKPEYERLPGKCRFTYTSFRPMVKYRRQLSGNLNFTLQGGFAVKMSCRANGVTSRKVYFDCRQKVAPFVQTGVTYTM
ncbi:MAG: hypothetical protein K2M57_02200 [Paramuribaculum sp.]|nr:hypothetical protein [Paramuribaculum sp.]